MKNRVVRSSKSVTFEKGFMPNMSKRLSRRVAVEDQVKGINILNPQYEFAQRQLSDNVVSDLLRYITLLIL